MYCTILIWEYGRGLHYEHCGLFEKNAKRLRWVIRKNSSSMALPFTTGPMSSGCAPVGPAFIRCGWFCRYHSSHSHGVAWTRNTGSCHRRDRMGRGLSRPVLMMLPVLIGTAHCCQSPPSKTNIQVAAALGISTLNSAIVITPCFRDTCRVAVFAGVIVF